MEMKNEFVLIGCAVLGAYLLVSYLGEHAQDIIKEIPTVAADTAASVVIGTGKIIGIPETNETECEKALREGRTWDASFACPAGTFLGSFF
jgi:hypothetical protein